MPLATLHAVEVRDLRCEYLADPLGIDVAKPRLNWVIEDGGQRSEVRDQKSAVRGLKQMAYQVLVASTPELLAKDQGDLWDSSKVASDQSIQVEYDGKPLVSRQQCFWKVRVWLALRGPGEGGTATTLNPEARTLNPSDWSQPALWSMGLLKPADWSAKWISMKQSQWFPHAEELDLDGAQWIWYSGDASDKPIGKRYFRRQFSLPENIKSAVITLSADDRFTLLLNGKPLKESGEWRNPVTVDLTKTVKAGANLLEVQAENNGEFAGLIGRLKIVPEQGAPVEIVTDASWESSEKNDPPRWQPAKVLGAHGITPWGKITGFGKGQPAQGLNSRNSPMLRKSFALSKPAKQAQLSICGLGYYELFLNGAKVGDHVLDPAWTCYHKNALYVTYDISNALKQGGNALGVQLANGVYNQEFGDAWNFQIAPWRAFPQMLLQLDITYADGTRQRIVSDETWKVSDGPICWDQLRMGVTYDARREHPGWDKAGFDDSAWQAAIVREGVKGKLAAQVCEPIKVMKTLKPVSIAKGDGVCEVDFGQNISGWTRLKVSGKAGTQVTLDHGSFDLVHVMPNQIEVYTLKGSGGPSSPLATPSQEDLEVWEPGFTYHGFRKVKVTGFPGTPEKENFEARVVHTAFEERGAFECSNPLLNKIAEAARWSYIGNFVGIPTDCPHREKNGWSGDAQVAAELGLTYYGSEAAYTRWMLDFQAIQADDGKLPCIVPTGGWGSNQLDGPAWEIAYIMIPWHIYEYRGDRRILAVHYENYKRWIEWYRKHPVINKGHIIRYGLGDWVQINTKTPPEITSTGYYYAAAKRIAAIAGMLGKTDDAREYSALAEDIRNAFNKEFYHPDTGLYWEGSQTAMSCALYHGLVDPANRDRVVKNLVDSIRKNNYALNCGLLGSKYLLRVLCDNGHADVAYAMVVKDDTPGWGRMIRTGNTTLWENFEGSGSNNHVFLGDVAAWFMNYLAGIRPDPANPGFQRFLIKPEIVGDLTWVKAHHDSPYGRIQSEWKREGDAFALDISVPANSTAEVAVPASKADEVTESGKPAAKAQGVKWLRMENGAAVYEVGSGSYRFCSGK
ncbi:MAG: family 78 glycoside hydrolase catalytic domain [Kiritimatiellaeota bacterium]|nr:family 78 glycoside hydrolase catalytic domain [Kiritimatiellota bacterium]